MTTNLMIERRSLYDQGLSDRQIALAQGVDRTAIRDWRRTRGLPPKTVRRYAAIGPSTIRRFLSDMKWNDGEIGQQEGVHPQCVREWRIRNRLPAHGLRRSARQRDEQLKELQRRVCKAIGTSLPLDIASDAAAELMMAVIQGTVAIDDIEKVGRSFGNKALQTYADAFKFTSLDEPVAGTEDLLRIELLRDNASEDWLEEMGATSR